MTARRTRTARNQPTPDGSRASRLLALQRAQEIAAGKPGTVVVPQDDGSVLIANSPHSLSQWRPRAAVR